MTFEVFADGSANLPKSMLEGISLLPCEYSVNDQIHTYLGDVDNFDAHSFYEGLKNGNVIKTTLLNTSLFLSHFTPLLEKGKDVFKTSIDCSR